MIDMEIIQAAADRLAAAASSPSRVILFGSNARGTANEGSDLDLMVLEQELTDKAAEYLGLSSKRRAAPSLLAPLGGRAGRSPALGALREALGRIAPGVGVDLLIYPLAEFERRSQVPGTLHFEARLEGKVLHDALL
jgi:hypothetical protein